MARVKGERVAGKDWWRKTLIYFGLAEEPEYDPSIDRGGGAVTEDLERSYSQRPNVRKLERPGRRSRYEEYDDIYSDDDPYPSRRTAVLRPKQVADPGNYSRQGEARTQVHLILPRSFNDAQQIADKFKEDVPVIINLQSSEADLAKRLIDFSSGLTYALDGGMQRVAEKVFLLTPRTVEVSAEERAEMLEKGFFNQY